MKLGVPSYLTVNEKDILAQIFLEAIYCSSNEGEAKQMVCVLTNGLVWHMIITDLKFIKYHHVEIEPKSYNAANICDIITNFVNES